jgi:sigma-E factor negative regulatory protein RseC
MSVMSVSNQANPISHKGIVQKCDENSVLVTITAHTACSGCHAEGACTMSGKEEKVIEVNGSYNVKQGDEVTVHMNKSTGYTALLLAYLIPLLAIVSSLIILTLLKVSELTAGILSVAILIPYFTVLFLFRNRFTGRFIFTLND